MATNITITIVVSRRRRTCAESVSVDGLHRTCYIPL